MATNNNETTGGLFGEDAFFASRPRSATVAGGLQEPGAQGIEPVPSKKAATLQAMAELVKGEDPAPRKKTLMDADDAEAFKAVNELVLRQDPLAKSRLAQDVHWTAVKMGFPFSTLEKTQNQDAYQQNFPPGYTLRIAAVPNKAADLCNKLVETLLVDAPEPDPEPLTDDEVAQKGAEMAREFLRQDGGEAGTNDLQVFAAQLERATTCASAFLYLWVDESGGGSVAKQIRAHPLATDPANPLVGLDPLTGQDVPTPDYVLRYVTPDGQFTDNPSDAERVWVPKIRVEKLGREHVRFYPETADIDTCESVILLRYCTIGQAKKRWPESVGTYSDAELDALCAWTPPRYQAVLPPAIRARYNTASASQKDIAGSAADERIVFYYAYYRKADPVYPEGAALFLSGADNGTILGRDTLTCTVTVPSGDRQDKEVTDLRDLDIPLVQIRLVQDADDGDPTGKAVIGRVAGAGEASATLMTGLLTALDKALHPARFVTATSPLSDDDIEGSRAGGKLAVILNKDDAPVYEEPPVLPGLTMDAVSWNYAQMDSSIGLNKPAQGSDDAQEVSGVARRIAIQQSVIALSRMQAGATVAFERYWRLKLQLAMKYFSVPQLLRYVGVDGASKEQWFTGNNFAMVGGVRVAKGTGTMLPATEKVNFALQLRDAGVADPDEVSELTRPAFAKSLGAPENPHVQRIERQLSSWMEGPPEGWEEEAQAYAEQMVAFAQSPVDAMGMPLEEPQMPWTPFATVPVDFEPAVAALRMRRLGRLMAKVAFSEQPEAWQALVIRAYEEMKAAGAPQPTPEMVGPAAPIVPPDAELAGGVPAA